MTISDWVLICTTLFLGAIALLTPLVSEKTKRKYFSPSLEISFERYPPFCLKTFFGPPNPFDTVGKEPVYYFRFKLKNTGKSQLRRCEAVLEEFWVYDSAGLPQKNLGFTDINLKWSGSDPLSPRFIDINPNRHAFCDIGHIASMNFQNNRESKFFFDVPGKITNNLRFLFELVQYPLSQPNCLLPGKYGVKISLYSENAESKSSYFEIAWSGIWQDEETEMFREFSIRQIQRLL